MIDPFIQTWHVFGRKFLGTECLRNPIDAWVVQEIIYETKPDTIVEVGTYMGGSAKYYAFLLDAIGNGRVITVDIAPRARVEHPRITQVVGDCQVVFPEVQKMVEGRVMVILDCSHTTEHVTKELATYATLVTKGCYLIVEDTLFNDGKHGAGKAVDPWIPKQTMFVVDKKREIGELTYNVNGFLKRK